MSLRHRFVNRLTLGTLVLLAICAAFCTVAASAATHGNAASSHVCIPGPP